MAFCVKCGAQVSEDAAVCPACGQTRVPGVRPGTATTGFSNATSGAASNAPPVAGGNFFASLFDLSFTSFITTKLIKILYVIGVILAGLWALGLIIGGFAKSTLAGVFMLIIVAPLAFFFAVIYWRVVMELIIVIFRAAEHLGEIARQTRRPVTG